MRNQIKITKNLEFELTDLMKTVDVSQEFTLGDLLRAVENSKIDRGVLERILQCPYIFDYVQEAKSKKKKGNSEIEYLEIRLISDISEFDGKIDASTFWAFHGMGKKGVISDDLKQNCTKSEIKKMIKNDWQESYALEFTPIYELVDFPIKISKDIAATDWRNKDTNSMTKNIEIRPTITLLQLLYAIFYEFSFLGSIKQRETKLKDLQHRAKEYQKAKEEGRLNEICIPWEEAKKRLKKKIKKIAKKQEK